MRNALLRTILSYVGITISGVAIGATFAWALAAAKLGMFMTFIWFLLTAILAMLGLWKVVIPTVSAWAKAEADELIPSDILAKFKAKFDAVMPNKAAA